MALRSTTNAIAPQQTTLYQLQQHAVSFIAHTEASTSAELPRFIKDDLTPSSSAASWQTAS